MDATWLPTHEPNRISAPPRCGMQPRDRHVKTPQHLPGRHLPVDRASRSSALRTRRCRPMTRTRSARQHARRGHEEADKAFTVTDFGKSDVAQRHVPAADLALPSCVALRPAAPRAGGSRPGRLGRDRGVVGNAAGGGGRKPRHPFQGHHQESSGSVQNAGAAVPSRRCANARVDVQRGEEPQRRPRRSDGQTAPGGVSTK